MSIRVFFVNAFADEYYRGNQAAIVLVRKFPSQSSMQSLAKEFGFSETAFISRKDKGSFFIKWFTPETEVKLCGHATLAAAKVIFSEQLTQNREIIFYSQSGELFADITKKTIRLNFPSDTPQKIDIDKKILSVFGFHNFEDILYAPKTKNLLLVYKDYNDILTIKPRFESFRNTNLPEFLGIIVTASPYKKYDYICRYFAPWEGIIEDPVTGSAQVSLAPYWSGKLLKKMLNGYQASARGGDFEVQYRNDRVFIKGKAFIYLRGHLERGF